MNQSLLFALGAGMGSGLLFILPMKGSLMGMWLSVLAPLPLLIVAMGFGARAGLLTAGVGAAIAALFQPGLAVVFILSSALPSLILAAITRRVFTVEDPLAPGTLLTATMSGGISSRCPEASKKKWWWSEVLVSK